jgi:chromosomal replication initiation ATPase DnaA
MNWTKEPPPIKTPIMSEDIKKPLIKFIADMYEIEHVEDLYLDTRKHPYCPARQVAMFMIMEYGEENAATVGPYFIKDRTTALHAHKTVTKEYQTNRGFAAKLDIIIDKYNSLVDIVEEYNKLTNKSVPLPTDDNNLQG